jgi:putative hydrolase of the HAD superfamily
LLPVITFDAGQTLVELDLDFLAIRLRERGTVVDTAALERTAPAAWAHYDALVDEGRHHRDAWRALIEQLIVGGGELDRERARALAAWLFSENATANLWRRPISGMVELARDLAARGVVVGVLSNSEGRLAELLDSVGIASLFAAIIDSGRLQLEKPDPRIFAHALDALGVSESHPAIHIGDSWEADVIGARRAGWRALWYGRRARPTDGDPNVAYARDSDAARAVIERWLAG